MRGGNDDNNNKLTEEMKLDAVVVTVARAEEEQCRRALEKNVHMVALQASRRAPHSSRRGMPSCGHKRDELEPGRSDVTRVSLQWVKEFFAVKQ